MLPLQTGPTPQPIALVIRERGIKNKTLAEAVHCQQGWLSQVVNSKAGDPGSDCRAAGQEPEEPGTQRSDQRERPRSGTTVDKSVARTSRGPRRSAERASDLGK